MSRRAKLEQMSQDDPDDVFLHYAIAQELASEGRPEQALKKLDELLQRFADYVPAWFSRGRILAEIGRTPEARQTLKDGISVALRVGDTHAAGEMRELIEQLTETESDA